MSSVRDPVGVKLRRLRNLRFTDEEQAWLANAARRAQSQLSVKASAGRARAHPRPANTPDQLLLISPRSARGSGPAVFRTPRGAGDDYRAP
jgi:hypothetical protein